MGNVNAIAFEEPEMDAAQFAKILTGLSKVVGISRLSRPKKSDADCSKRCHARLPSCVPVLCSAFRLRESCHRKLKQLLLHPEPKSKISSQGMGGIGKTMQLSALIRDPDVTSAFELLGWITMNQRPDILSLQQLLYIQLTGMLTYIMQALVL